MSERQTPQSHSRVKNITNKNTFPQSEKKDGGKISTNATANDSQAVVNHNRQQRFHHQNSPSYNPAFAKSDHQYFSQQKAPYKYKNNSNQGQSKSGKYLILSIDNGIRYDTEILRYHRLYLCYITLTSDGQQDLHSFFYYKTTYVIIFANMYFR